MKVTFADTDPVEYPVIPGRPYYISAAGGTLTVERKKLDGTWIAVKNSPIADGDELRLQTYSDTDKIRVTASIAGVEMILEK